MAEVKMSKKVTKIMARLDKSKNHKSKYEPGWKEFDEFYRSDQYKGSKLPPWVPKPVTNFIHLVVTTKRAALAGENPMATMRPLGPEDVDNIADLQKVYEWVWKKIKARNVLRDNIETSKLLGTAIAYVYWDEHTGVLGGTNAHYEGEIKLKEIDPMNFHIDPNAYRLEEAAWVHITEKRSREWVAKEFGINLEEVPTQEDNYGEKYNRDYYKESEKNDGQIDFHAHYERYWNTDHVMQEPHKQGDMPDPNIPMQGGMPDPNIPIQTMIDDTGASEPIDTGEEIGGWNYKVTYIAGTKELQTIDPLEPNMYPFAVLYDFKQRQEFWGRGTASLIIDNQKLINKVESIIAMIGTLLQNPQKVITKASGINPVEAMKYSFAPGHVWVTSGNDPAGAMHWQSPPDIPQALVNLAEMAKENIREITGMNEAYMGQSVGSLQTSGGVNSLIDRATMRDKDQMFDIEEYIDQLTRVIMGFVTTKYTEERYVRLIEDKSKPDQTTKFIEFTGTDFADMEYDLDIDVSAHAPVTQARRESELTDLMQLQGQYQFNPKLIIPQEYIKGKRMVDADKIVDRMNKEEMQNKLDMLQQVYKMTADSVAAGVPMDEIMGMAEKQLQALESGQVPLDPNVDALGGGGTGSAADNQGAMQSQQAGM